MLTLGNTLHKIKYLYSMTINEMKFEALKTKNEKRLFVLKLCKCTKYKRLMKYKKISSSTVEIAFKISQGIKVEIGSGRNFRHGFD